MGCSPYLKELSKNKDSDSADKDFTVVEVSEASLNEGEEDVDTLVLEAVQHIHQSGIPSHRGVKVCWIVDDLHDCSHIHMSLSNKP